MTLILKFQNPNHRDWKRENVGRTPTFFKTNPTSNKMDALFGNLKIYQKQNLLILNIIL